MSAPAAFVTVVPGAVGVAGALTTEVLPRIDVGAANGSSVDVSVSSGLSSPSVCTMLVTEAALVAASGDFGKMARGLPRVKVGTTMETMAQEEEEE